MDTYTSLTSHVLVVVLGRNTQEASWSDGSLYVVIYAITQ